jgi:hypothetical protein
MHFFVYLCNDKNGDRSGERISDTLRKGPNGVYTLLYI